jgi:beta-glucosidase
MTRAKSGLVPHSSADPVTDQSPFDEDAARPDPIDFGASIDLSWAQGATPGSDWHRWADTGHVAVNGEGNGFVSRYGEDLSLMALAGATSVRIGVDWTALMPSPRRWDGQAVEHITSILLAARQAGLAPWLSLHRFDLPGWFIDGGDFRDETNRKEWSRFVDGCGERFGDLVAGWIPLFEPLRWARDAFWWGRTPPGKRDPETFAYAVSGVMTAQRDAWRQLRGGPPVATAFDLMPIHPVDYSIPAEKKAKGWERYVWNTPIIAVRDGTLEVPGLALKSNIGDLANCCDIIGFTYSAATAVDREGNWVAWPPHVPPGPLGWAPWAEGVALTVRRLSDAFPSQKLALMGTGVPGADDRRRADVVGEVRDHLIEAKRDGIDITHALYDGWVDGYRPESGTDHPWGLVTDNRHPKPSASAWFNHSVD